MPLRIPLLVFARATRLSLTYLKPSYQVPEHNGMSCITHLRKALGSNGVSLLAKNGLAVSPLFLLLWLLACGSISTTRGWQLVVAAKLAACLGPSNATANNMNISFSQRSAGTNEHMKIACYRRACRLLSVCPITPAHNLLNSLLASRNGAGGKRSYSWERFGVATRVSLHGSLRGVFFRASSPGAMSGLSQVGATPHAIKARVIVLLFRLHRLSSCPRSQ